VAYVIVADVNLKKISPESGIVDNSNKNVTQMCRIKISYAVYIK